MAKVVGAALIGWPFFALAWVVGWEFFLALAAGTAITVSIFAGCYLWFEGWKIPAPWRKVAGL